MTVSILEDELVLLDALSSALERLGIKVQGRHSSAKEFITDVRHRPPAVALIDLTLEDSEGHSLGDGMQVIEELRRSLPEVQTIVLSTLRDPAVVDRCREVGASAYLFKHTTAVSGVFDALRAVSSGERLFPFTGFGRNTHAPAAVEAGPLDALSVRELQVLRYVTAGLDNAKIAAHLNITERTVKAHLASMYRKLDCENRTQVALRARELGVLPHREA